MWLSEDIQKLPLATVVCCNPPDKYMIDSCEPIPFFPNLAAFLDKKGPVAEMEIYSDIAFLFLLYTEKEDEEENTCM